MIFQVFVAIIHGPNSAKELMNGILSIPRTDTMARKHGIRNTTPGAIASSAVLVCYISIYFRPDNVLTSFIRLVGFFHPMTCYKVWAPIPVSTT